MKKVLLTVLSSLLIYGYFNELTFRSSLTILLFSFLCFLFAKVRLRFVELARYPLIATNLIGSILNLMVPSFAKIKMMDTFFEFVSIFSIILFLAFLHRKERGFLKEVVPLFLVYSSSWVNLFVHGQLTLILPISVAGAAYLYVTMRTRLLLFLLASGLFSFLFLLFRGMRIHYAPSTPLGIQKFVLFGASFLLFFISFLHFVRDRKLNPAYTFVFLGMMVLAFDNILTFGFSFQHGLAHKPYLTSLVVVLLTGMLMKGERELT